MPNCDFYAVGDDFVNILGFVFSELNCRIFELYSDCDNELCEFKSFQEICNKYEVGFCKKRLSSVNLILWPVNASNEVKIEKIELNPKACKGATYRFKPIGWGLITLYLGGISELGIVHSHTNHNSEKRARSWGNTQDEKMGSVESWDWQEVNRISNKLNRFIKKNSVTKLGSRPVLPEAALLLSTGIKAL